MSNDPATGIYIFDGSEPDVPMRDTFNLLAESTRQAVARIDAEQPNRPRGLIRTQQQKPASIPFGVWTMPYRADDLAVFVSPGFADVSAQGLVVPASGWYTMTFYARFASDPDGTYRSVGFTVNGDTSPAAILFESTERYMNGYEQSLSTAGSWFLNAGDVLAPRAVQDADRDLAILRYQWSVIYLGVPG